MLSLIISSAHISTTESMIRNKFEELELGEFTVSIKPSQCKGKDCLKVFIHFNFLTHDGNKLREKLIENDMAQKAGEHIDPVKIVYDMYRGRERYWTLYLAPPPRPPHTPVAPTPYKARIVY